MSATEISLLQDKIAMVKKDIIKLQSEFGKIRQISVLNDYILYLEDEIKSLENLTKT